MFAWSSAKITRCGHASGYPGSTVAEALDYRVSIVSSTFVKNGHERLIVVNPIAKSVVEAFRGISPTHIFMYKDKPIIRMVTAA
jgi:hypothetical protein